MTKSKSADDGKEKQSADQGWRETVESIAMAIILALLFRGFVAEAFVIPTGSMAPTLQGRHKDVACPKCGKWYQASASDEINRDGSASGATVISATCSVCRYTQMLDPGSQPNDASFSGDRIIVGKFAYDLADPQRWDVIVFKFPHDARENYIKRLVFLPNETGRIVGGNVYATTTGNEDDLRICRKPPHKLDAMLQIVDDTDFIPPELTQLGWPTRWGQRTQVNEATKAAWKTDDGGRSFVCDGTATGDAILRYRHLVPSPQDWHVVETEKKLPAGVAERRGQLIADYYAYNAKHSIDRSSYYADDSKLPDPQTFGVHWVDDLAVECLANVTGNQGELLIDLVRAGVRYQCRINVADGKAKLTARDIDGTQLKFGDFGEPEVAEPTALTTIKGPGSYRLRLSNCDHEVLLWVNGSVVKFDGPTTYDTGELANPVWTPTDFGDLEPAGIGARACAVKLSQLRIFRDKYYIALDERSGDNDYTQEFYCEKTFGNPSPDYLEQIARIQDILADPDKWSSTGLFESRRDAQFQLEKDHFFPMGDNSPHSYDARLWNTPQSVKRDLLIGKALMIYWPHTWNRPVPFTPNFSRMGRIR